MNYNHPQFRNMAGQLAELFDSEEGERILRLITWLADSGDGRGSLTEETPGDKPEKLRGGIWEATGDGSFVRVNTGEPMHFWANVQKIPPKGPRRRIVLVGESVARGFL